MKVEMVEDRGRWREAAEEEDADMKV